MIGLFQLTLMATFVLYYWHNCLPLRQFNTESASIAHNILVGLGLGQDEEDDDDGGGEDEDFDYENVKDLKQIQQQLQ